MARFVAAPPGVAERAGVRDLHAVAGAHAADVKHAGMGEPVQLPLLWRVKRRPWFAGGAAAGLQLHRRRLHSSGDVAVDQAEGWVLFWSFLMSAELNIGSLTMSSMLLMSPGSRPSAVQRRL